MMAIPTEALIREIVEIGVDDEVPNFTMEGDWYEDYAMDSLGAVALQMEVYKRLGVRIPEPRMPDIRTGTQLLAVIAELQAAAPSDAAGGDTTGEVLVEPLPKAA